MYEYRKLTLEQRQALVQERVERGLPSHRPPHFVRDHVHYLLTAACYGHKPYIADPTRRRSLQDQVFAQFLMEGIEIHAWVVLPNHYHVLAAIPDFGPVSRIFKQVHGTIARQWNLDDQQVGRKIWYSVTDRAIRSERHYYTTLNYLHFNPVKHGWAASPYEWLDSSVHWYMEHLGREWLRDLWTRYPVLDYGQGWDERLGAHPE